jgi:TPR repeat protein
MKKHIARRDRSTGTIISASLVVAAYVVAGGLESGAGASEYTTVQSVAEIQSAAAGGDGEALFWLAMMHIEGSIENADYDKGIELLRISARRGNKDAERMWSFMDNAFSGDGC